MTLTVADWPAAAHPQTTARAPWTSGPIHPRATHGTLTTLAADLYRDAARTHWHPRHPGPTTPGTGERLFTHKSIPMARLRRQTKRLIGKLDRYAPSNATAPAWLLACAAMSLSTTHHRPTTNQWQQTQRLLQHPDHMQHDPNFKTWIHTQPDAVDIYSCLRMWAHAPAGPINARIQEIIALLSN